MAFSSTIDTRPAVMGNLLMVTGTFNAAGVNTGTIDLTSFITDIKAAGALGTAGSGSSGAGVDGVFVLDVGAAALSIDCVAGQTGIWWAMGPRS
mgnify:CR=1 FL=1